MELILPKDMEAAAETFKVFYQGRNSGRRLYWQHSLGSNTVTAEMGKAGQKEFHVSTPQAVVLLLFNSLAPGQSLSYKGILAQTGMEATELKRTLQSLACGQIPTRVLRKSPQGKDVNEEDTFIVNENLKNDRARIRINQIQERQTVREVALGKDLRACEADFLHTFFFARWKNRKRRSSTCSSKESSFCRLPLCAL